MLSAGLRGLRAECIGEAYCDAGVSLTRGTPMNRFSDCVAEDVSDDCVVGESGLFECLEGLGGGYFGAGGRTVGLEVEDGRTANELRVNVVMKE